MKNDISNKYNTTPPKQPNNDFFKDLPTPIQEKIIDAELKKKNIDRETDKDKHGVFGYVFGIDSHASRNIAGMLIFLLIVIAAIYTGVQLHKENIQTHNQVLDFWEIVVPIITLSIGYLFGVNKKEES